ncbi:MAG: precorrin-6B methylase 2 [Natronomonas sp.]|jgi:precorrin-6B methylase 2|uniref:class I SAM-dependent methyltransferase n=1 Tax=Natronomonas sp. TaxID=2184060 RepID=UPI0039E347FC
MERFQNTRQPDWDWWGWLWPTPGATLRELGVESGESLVEIGSGNGYFALPAARITDPAPVYAVDVDESLLDELRHLADQQDVENVVPVHADARSLADHLPERVDTCLLANTLHGVAGDEQQTFIEAVFEALKPGGTFVVINWRDVPKESTTIAGEQRGPPPALRLSPEETQRIVENGADFTRTRRVDLPPYHYALIFEA